MAAWRHVYIALAFGRYDAKVPAMRATLQPVYDELIKSSVIAPVGLSDDEDDDEQRMFVDFELASLAEHRLGDRTDPRVIDDVRRTDWKARATHEDSTFVLPKDHRYQTCFWLLEGGKRVGTIAFSEPMGSSMARCYSFYLLPEVRGRGLGSAIMMQVLQALDKHRFCLRLNTDWTWQRTVRFYRKLGFWVYHWKRELDLIWTAKWPKARVEVGSTEASLSIPYDDSEVTLVRAYRKGDKLELEQAPSELEKDPKIGETWFFATPTLALELAMHGWPLIRSMEQWEGIPLCRQWPSGSSRVQDTDLGSVCSVKALDCRYAAACGARVPDVGRIRGAVGERRGTKSTRQKRRSRWWVKKRFRSACSRPNRNG
jgi:GNAT superfamily N-acetyltransferase